MTNKKPDNKDYKGVTKECSWKNNSYFKNKIENRFFKVEIESSKARLMQNRLQIQKKV